ncbi:septum formation family protein [Amycolatopsis suaedae]|uniref:Septum formation-related domain-containing protein n=1 Tax=Amycolatopsis suaedae TaxID=2510978 RepID=A0A4Q7JCQ0_9PSEU|nr:septum formation family protein [Amycolatopsis suaedae]RZQ65097.1 hypothetical protein EWH70_04150 [Amycolatopsis suaedae]
MRLSHVVMAALVVTTLAACTTQVSGRAVAGAPPPPPPSPSAPATPTSGRPGLPEAGQCVAGDSLTPIDCTKPHTVEVTKGGTFPMELPATRPPQLDIFKAALPDCRAEAARYLGSDAYDATTLAAWMLWASEQDWQAGNRWYRCGIAQLTPDNKAMMRAGTVRGALAGDGFYAFQACSSVKPQEAAVARVDCAGPHVAEGLAVVPMGKPTDPIPSPEQFNAAARPKCTQALVNYLGTSTRSDVLAAWRWPSQQEWAQGYTNVTCFAQVDAPVTRQLKGIGNAPLPR